MGKLNIDPALLRDGRPSAVVAGEIGCSPVTVWRARQREGIACTAKRGPQMIDRRSWPWGTMSFRKLGEMHGITGQRAHQIWKKLHPALKETPRT